MRKAFISFLIMTLMLTNISLVNISSVQAATTNTTDSTIKVSLGNIREIMTENSLDIKNLNNNLKIAKEQYENAKNDLDDAQENLEDAEDAEDTEEETGDTGTAEAAVEAAEAAVDTTKENLKSVKSEYEQGVENKIYDAQEAYLNYLSSLADVKLKEDTVKSKLKEVQTSKLKYENGFLSKNDYIELGLGNKDSSNELIKIKADLELSRIKLCNTLGLSPNEDITFESEIIEDFKVISKINFKDDLNEMIDNSINIKLQKDEVEDAEDAEDDNDDEDKDDIYEYKVDTAKNKLKQLTNTEQTSFIEQYNTLMSSYNSIKNSYDQIIQKQTVYKTTQVKFDYGYISQSDLDTAKLTFDTDMAKFIKDRNGCYLKYLKYIQMKEGY